MTPHLTVERTLNRFAGRFAYIGKPPVAVNDQHGPMCNCWQCEHGLLGKHRHRCLCGKRTHCSCFDGVA